MAELVEMLLEGGGQNRMNPMNHIIDGVHKGATRQIRLNDTCSAAV